MALLGGAAVSQSLAAHAQQPAKPVIGFLSGATSQTMHEYVVAFNKGLASTGFAEARNVAIEYLWAEGHNDRLPALAADFVRRGVDIIVAGASTPGALAAKAATQTIPIVFFIGTDPVKVGLITSLAQPGGNITGITVLVGGVDRKIASANAQPNAAGHEDRGARQSGKYPPNGG